MVSDPDPVSNCEGKEEKGWPCRVKWNPDLSLLRKIGILGRGIRIIDICYPVHHAVSTTNILVTMPEEVVKVDVHLSKNSQGAVYLYDRENTEIQQIDFDIRGRLPIAKLAPEGTRSAKNPCLFLSLGRFNIIRVCGVTEEAQDTFEYNGGLNTHLQA